MIYATVGTMYLDFPRLIHACDAIAESTDERVVVQIGMSRAIPRFAEYFAFKPRGEILALQEAARVIVSHAGIGSSVDGLQAGRPLILVPRLARHGEHNNDHQVQLAEALHRRGLARMIADTAELAEACAAPPAAPGDYRPDKQRLLENLRGTVSRRTGIPLPPGDDCD